MLGRIFTVGGYTLLSRLTGFARDIMLAAILGAGPVADAFFVALRLPNHFRAIFAEGAFNAAFVPAYAHVHGGRCRRRRTCSPTASSRCCSLSQVVLLAVAWLFMPQVIATLAPGFADDPVRGELAIALTRITFPYLLLITLVTLYGGMLNVMHRFASAAAAPIFLNLSMMATLALAAFFPECRSCRGMGRADLGLPAIFSAGGRRRAAAACCRGSRRSSSMTMSAPFFRALGPGHARLDGHAGRAVRRHHHRDLPPGGRAVGAVLCRPAQSTADRRDRHRHRHRAAAGNVAAAHRGRSRRARWRRSAGRSISRCCFRCRSWPPS